MDGIIEFLKGKKSYFIALAAAVTAGLQALGYVIPEWVYALEAALFGAAIRSSIPK